MAHMSANCHDQADQVVLVFLSHPVFQEVLEDLVDRLSLLAHNNTILVGLESLAASCGILIRKDFDAVLMVESH